MPDNRHLIGAIVNGEERKQEYGTLDELMKSWEVAATRRVFPGTADPAVGLALTIAGRECARIPTDGWLVDQPREAAD